MHLIRITPTARPQRSAKLSCVGIGLIAAALALWSAQADAANYSIRWLSMSNVNVGAVVPPTQVFTLDGYGNVTLTYTNPSSPPTPPWQHTRGTVPNSNNGYVSYGGDKYQWTTAVDGLVQTNHNAGSSTPIQYSVTYTFALTVKAKELVLGVFGLGRLDSIYAGKITRIGVNQNGTSFGDFQLPPYNGVNYGQTEVLSAIPPPGFVLQNSALGNGIPNDRSFNSSLAVIRIDDAVSFLTLHVTQIGQDGIGFTVGRIVPPATNGDYINKNLKNVGPPASDLAVVLKGNVLPLRWHCYGFIWPLDPSRGFNNFSATLDQQGNTLLRWWNYTTSGYGGATTTIPTDGSVHIGWGVKWPLKFVPKDSYWTDANGNRIQGSYVVQKGAYGETDGVSWTRGVFTNDFAPWGIPDSNVTIRHVQFATFTSFLHPDSLNPLNLLLESAFEPMSPDTVIPLPYGQSVSIPFPRQIPKDQWVVLKFIVSAPGSAAEVVDYVELTPQTGDIPTLSEWGAIIFGTLLLASVAFYIWRRRRAVTA